MTQTIFTKRASCANSNKEMYVDRFLSRKLGKTKLSTENAAAISKECRGI